MQPTRLKFDYETNLTSTTTKCDNFAIATIVCRSPFATISPSQPSFADPHSRRSSRRDHRLSIPFTAAMISPNRSPSPSLLFAVVAFTVVTFARRHRWGSPSSLKLDRRRWSNPSDISAPSHTDASAPTTLRLPPTPTVRLPFVASNPSDPLTSTSTSDPSPSLQTFLFFS